MGKIKNRITRQINSDGQAAPLRSASFARRLFALLDAADTHCHIAAERRANTMGFLDFLTARKKLALRHAQLDTHPPFDELAQRIKPVADWGDLVLPDEGRQILRQIAEHMRRLPRLYERLGFSAKRGGNLGNSVLFAGGSSRDRTIAAEVLASDLQFDMYRIDLSQVVSKYIGETEKNLRRLFDVADVADCVLFFDEADALFGRRTEVKDAHDRYANLEISYLLERMERFRGLAILATNRRKDLDEAFLRRLRDIVEFPDPDTLVNNSMNLPAA